MAHFAVICPPDAGHVLSMGALGVELCSRGHRVTLVTQPKAAPMAKKLPLDFHPLDMQGVSVPFPHLLWAAFSLVGASSIAVTRNWVRVQSELALRCLPQTLRELEVEGAVIDQTVAAGGTVLEYLGIPFVTVCSALPWNEDYGVPPPFKPWRFQETPGALWRNRTGYATWHWFMAPTLKIINRYRKDWGLLPWTRIDDGFSQLAQISQLCQELDFPRREIPTSFHYIGSLAADRQDRADDSFPWDRLDGRPLVFASLGTVPDPANLAVFRKITEACADLPLQLVLALGRWNDQGGSVREKMGKLPGNQILVDFAPQLALLDRAALLITHGGVNTVLESLTRGVPMVALPRSTDQLGMGARIEYSGVGLLGSFKHSRAAELRVLVHRVLKEQTFRHRAEVMGQALRAAGGVKRSAEIAEEALITRRPVVVT